MIYTTLYRLKVERSVLLSTLLTGMLLSVGVEAFGAGGGSRTFAYTGSLNTARYNHTATLLPNGEVFVVGGLGVNGVSASLASVELYDPQKGKWTTTGSKSVGPTGLTATLLTNGLVLVAGGSDYYVNCYATDASQYYLSTNGTWHSIQYYVSPPRWGNTLTLLNTGKALAAGGNTKCKC